MSQADIELVCRSFDLWNRGDLTEWIAVHHPDVVVVPPDGWPEGAQTLFSRDEWLAQAVRLIDSWAEQRFEIQRVAEAGDSVLVLFSWITRGKGSDIPLVTDMAGVATMHDGLVTRWVFFNDPAEALEAVGLSE
jgi:ketosteroid isomerase-like protein